VYGYDYVFNTLGNTRPGLLGLGSLASSTLHLLAVSLVSRCHHGSYTHIVFHTPTACALEKLKTLPTGTAPSLLPTRCFVGSDSPSQNIIAHCSLVAIGLVQVCIYCEDGTSAISNMECIQFSSGIQHITSRTLSPFVWAAAAWALNNGTDINDGHGFPALPDAIAAGPDTRFIRRMQRGICSLVGRQGQAV